MATDHRHGCHPERLALPGAGHMTGALGHDAHFGHTGARVRRGDIAPAQAVDEITHGLEQRLALAVMRVADDHGLAATERQACQGRFVGHATRQTQHVAQRLLVTGVVPHAATAQRRAKGAVMNGDDGFQAAGLVVAIDHLFVLIEVDVSEDGHRVTSVFGS